MPSLINRVPPGLLSLLGIKAIGENPSILPSELQGVIDVTPLYAAGFSEIVAAATAVIGGVGVFAPTALVVPPSELWIVNRGAAYATVPLAALTTYRLKLVVYDSVSLRILDAGPSTSAVATDRPLMSISGPFVLTPGEQLALFAEQVTLGTSQTFTIATKIARLSI